MYKIAVLGDRDSTLGFRALGLDVFFAEDLKTARETLHSLARASDEPYAVIYLTERLADGLSQDVARYKDQLTPAIIVIPGKSGPIGMGMNALRDAVERAVGVNILDT